ncbi:WD-REPEATS-REGION domain-containing protein [Mycena venus]|uniref:WD-REPEATS-REGION domain-containing protein n=1 Tax=Mycena venus TaxID=2733690 RepID=A0A8H6XMC1_9AGAR|nr:WD-REPEATS-REGION domain-containing protein [Mycena venus]
MRFRTLEIRWHDSKPISSCDFQPVPFKKARPPPGGDIRAFASQAYRLATAGEDNHVRVWMVHPNIRPAELEVDKDAGPPRPARVEYLATLSRHSAAVNVVRFSPNGELIASAGDDGMVIIWAPSATPQTSTYGSDLSPDDLQHEKEYWKPRTTFRCTTMQVYDLAWSPTGEFLLTGSTDNCARVFASADGKCMHEIAEHSHYVQGVAWDPLNEYIATQSSDRSMHVYRINTSKVCLLSILFSSPLVTFRVCYARRLRVMGWRRVRRRAARAPTPRATCRVLWLSNFSLCVSRAIPPSTGTGSFDVHRGLSFTHDTRLLGLRVCFLLSVLPWSSLPGAYVLHGEYPSPHFPREALVLRMIPGSRCLPLGHLRESESWVERQITYSSKGLCRRGGWSVWRPMLRVVDWTRVVRRRVSNSGRRFAEDKAWVVGCPHHFSVIALVDVEPLVQRFGGEGATFFGSFTFCLSTNSRARFLGYAHEVACLNVEESAGETTHAKCRPARRALRLLSTIEAPWIHYFPFSHEREWQSLADPPAPPLDNLLLGEWRKSTVSLVILLLHLYVRGTFEAHAIGRNTRFPVHHGRDRAHSRTPSVHRDELSLNLNLVPNMATPMNTPINPNSSSGLPTGAPGTSASTSSEGWGARPPMFRSASIESDRARDGGSEMPGTPFAGPGTPASMMPATPVVGASASGSSAVGGNASGRDSAMFPPPPAGPSSRRSSFSGSNAPSSPSGFSAVSGFSRYGRSPSPMPALPAIRTPPNASAGWAGRYEERTRSRERGGSTSSRYDERSGRHADERSGSAGNERGRYGYDERRNTDGARLYGDESFSNFFRRLAFSPDGGLLLTPAGTFEDPSASVVGWEAGASAAVASDMGEGGSKDDKATPAASTSTTPADDASAPARGRKARPVISTGAALASTSLGMGSNAAAPAGEASNSSVYIYSRANFARPPVAQLPGHKKASVAVRFSPVLFELRANVAGGASSSTQPGGGVEPRMGTGTATGEEGDAERARDVEESMDVDLVGPLPPATTTAGGSGSGQGIAAPAPQRSFDVLASPALSPIDSSARRPPTPAASKPGTPAPGYTTSASATPNTVAGQSSTSTSVTPNAAAGMGTGSVFALPYRMLYAVVTMDTVAIYDTQQAGPVCLLTKLHYDEFTDLAWSPDGQCLMLSARDGYCTLVTFDEILPTHHTQQAALQLQQIAAQHSVPISYAPSAHSQTTPSSSQSGSGRKRPHEPLTPATSVDGDAPPAPAPAGLPASTSATSVASFVSDTNTDATEGEGEAGADGPPKKKRRVALTRVGDL